MNAPALLRVASEPPLALVELDRKPQKHALSMALRDYARGLGIATTAEDKDGS